MAQQSLYNEAELICLIVEGDEVAFSKLFKHHYSKIYSVALKLTHSATIAEEIVEDVFLKIWMKRSSLHQIQNFSAYLFTITRNDTYKALKGMAKDFKITSLQDDYPTFANNNADHNLLGKEYNGILENAICRLPNQQEQVYRLIKEQGLKREEVAHLLHLSPETVKFHLSKAMKSIRTFCMHHLDLNIGLIIYIGNIF